MWAWKTSPLWKALPVAQQGGSNSKAFTTPQAPTSPHATSHDMTLATYTSARSVGCIQGGLAVPQSYRIGSSLKPNLGRFRVLPMIVLGSVSWVHFLNRSEITSPYNDIFLPSLFSVAVYRLHGGASCTGARRCACAVCRTACAVLTPITQIKNLKRQKNWKKIKKICLLPLKA